MERLAEADCLFRKVVRKFVKERDKIVIEGVMLPGFLVLNKLIQDGEQTLTQLANELDLTSGAITAMCDKLERQQLAVRTRHSIDRRVVLLSITDEGRSFMERHEAVSSRFISVLFDGFTQEQLVQQIQLYEQLLVNLDRLAANMAAPYEKRDVHFTY